VPNFKNLTDLRESEKPFWHNGAEWKATRITTKPTEYDILAGLEKEGPMTFGAFCDTFDYSNDSISDKATWERWLEEAIAVQALFSDCLEELEEIQ
jgi:hypothetical protein